MAVVGDFEPFRDLMVGAGQPEIAIENFNRHYRLLCDGASGLIPESEIAPVERLPDAAEFPTPSSSLAEQLLAKTAIVKLNGGLGTTMGLDRAKSLLAVKQGYTFLDIIANQGRLAGVPLVLMNSFRTDRDSLDALNKHRLDNRRIQLSFLQHQVPKVLKDSLAPAKFPTNPELAWCPPGHGDLYLALVTSGALQSLINAGIDYLFVSNADNLGATLDSSLLQYFSGNGLDFMMEAADRTLDDRKGGHLALRGGALTLREVAQCAEIDKPSFQDIGRHRYFNTNNIWINVPRLAEMMEREKNYLGLPLIRNLKTLDPKDPTTPEVYQLETAMGAAIEVFEKAAAVRVSRSRFAPVKTQADLDRVRSDEFKLTADYHLGSMDQRPPK
jgi:UTP--glucose-1-phosphate uridylyltransferase